MQVVQLKGRFVPGTESNYRGKEKCLKCGFIEHLDEDGICEHCQER